MPSIVDDLRRFGPDAQSSVSKVEAQAYCAELAATHYENFSVVSFLTPKQLRPAMEAIYAFCRWSDDLGDEVGGPAQSIALLSWWRRELERMFDGKASHPVMIVLRDVVQEYSIPIDPFAQLISAFEQDQTIVEYESYSQLLDYCSRSANPVGRLILYLGRSHDLENVELSDATCTGLQLANFWQDVARDLDIGRIYLPREDRIRFGYDDEMLKGRRFNPAFAELLAFEVERALALFRVGEPLAARIPGRLGLCVDLFNKGGCAILGQIKAQGFNVWKSRPTVSKLAKVRLIFQALLSSSRHRLGFHPQPPTVPSEIRS